MKSSRPYPTKLVAAGSSIRVLQGFIFKGVRGPTPTDELAHHIQKCQAPRDEKCTMARNASIVVRNAPQPDNQRTFPLTWTPPLSFYV